MRRTVPGFAQTQMRILCRLVDSLPGKICEPSLYCTHGNEYVRRIGSLSRRYVLRSALLVKPLHAPPDAFGIAIHQNDQGNSRVRPATMPQIQGKIFQDKTGA